VTEPSTVAAPSWTELTEVQWQRIQPLLPARAPTGRPPCEPRRVLSGVLWILDRHAAWRDLPAAFGPWRTVYGRYRLWRQTGLWSRIFEVLQDTLPSDPEVSL
jgi:transposase